MRSLSVAPVTMAKSAHIINIKGKTLRIRDEDQKALRQERCQHLWSGRRQRWQTRWKMARFSSLTGARTFKTMALPEDWMVNFCWCSELRRFRGRDGCLIGRRSLPHKKDSKTNFDSFPITVGNKHIKAGFFLCEVSCCLECHQISCQVVSVSSKILLLHKIKQPVKFTD